MPKSVAWGLLCFSPSLSFSNKANNLCDFACSIGLRFSIDHIRVASLGIFAISSIRLSIGIVLSPVIFCTLGPDPTSSSDLLHFIHCTVPCSVVFVDTDPYSSPSLPLSFKPMIASGIEFYLRSKPSLDHPPKPKPNPIAPTRAEAQRRSMSAIAYPCYQGRYAKGKRSRGIEDYEDISESPVHTPTPSVFTLNDPL
ncbi:uncharacterized protein LOC120255930 [Dioscorea cayenensis subsp. rotundata]|uniref:Uncharacterized protein LOC120255930 n=1 Tax=Dioscorea cayennensis subsp. rotundata TaxID=55577 RepID=A0AB40AXC2_DIOCR|nr:uncharacterized protein LOC120255930 [Dioscorea cayenensis subsp. rotundata]